MKYHSETPSYQEDLLRGKVVVKLLGLSAEQLSGMFDVSQRSASRWEHGKQVPPPDVLATLFSQLVVSDEVLGVILHGSVKDIKDTFGLSNADIGRMLGINASTVGKYSSGKRVMDGDLRDKLRGALSGLIKP